MLKQEKSPGAGDDQRVWVDIDWALAPVGESRGTVTIDGATPVTVSLTTLKASAEEARAAAGAFGGLAGPVALCATDATNHLPVGGVRWEKLPDFGRGAGAMSIFPVTAESILPPAPAPTLEYPVYLARAGSYDVKLVTNPTLNVIPSRGLRVAVSLNDQPPEIVNVFAPATARDEDFLGGRYGVNTRDGVRVMNFKVNAPTPGRHTLKITMVDPTIVVSKIVIHDQPLPPTYFGPPEAPSHPAIP